MRVASRCYTVVATICTAVALACWSGPLSSHLAKISAEERVSRLLEVDCGARSMPSNYMGISWERQQLGLDGPDDLLGIGGTLEARDPCPLGPPNGSAEESVPRAAELRLLKNV